MLDTKALLLPQTDNLQIGCLSRLFDNMSECYKLFWFQAIVNLVSDGKTELSYDELINEMIADSWYMVSEYNLNLGPADTLEALVHHVHNVSRLKTSEKKEKILDYLRDCDDSILRSKKRTLTYQVPYRLQAPFMDFVKKDEWKVSEKKLAQKINQEKRLIYYFSALNGLQTEIRITPEWQDYIVKNQAVLRGWICYHMVAYLQRRNPDVPGIIKKLNPPQERKLEKVQKYWKMIAEVMPVRDIYAEGILDRKDISIDHFVPWSYVAHDELWNLSPTTKSINSSKSNSLPTWAIYFPRLCEIEYLSYEAGQKYGQIKKAFEQCSREHVNSSEVMGRLYRDGLDRDTFSGYLEEIIHPIYQSAHNLGFKEWIYEKSNA
ncbi:MAG: HNH endonuclease domain-containing protein [Eubacteriales bacterium]|nr:HNH endonuclease domain-containing protein [Eubacteriales bacterium]